jgi:hypothetical protein
MAKNGEVQPLGEAVEHHENAEVRAARYQAAVVERSDSHGDEALKRRANGRQ